jgi:hypothetical protein
MKQLTPNIIQVFKRKRKKALEKVINKLFIKEAKNNR